MKNLHVHIFNVYILVALLKILKLYKVNFFYAIKDTNYNRHLLKNAVQDEKEFIMFIKKNDEYF